LKHRRRTACKWRDESLRGCTGAAPFLSLPAVTACRGKRIHDARLVATAIAHRVAVIATLNVEDFAAYGTRVRILPLAERRRPATLAAGVSCAAAV
jgi:hypothetical protein